MTDPASHNPLVAASPGGLADYPIAELKQHLLLYLPNPPGPKTVKQVLDVYFATWGDPFTEFCSTAFAATPEDWNAPSRQFFFDQLLPNLRKGRHWGYSLSDGRTRDSQALMFHGYFPVSEAEKASFFQFEFGWQVEPRRLMQFVLDVVAVLPCLSGYAGFMFQRHRTLVRSSYDQIYAWAHRYWGVEVYDVDASAGRMKSSFTCVNWITILGHDLAKAFPEAMATARRQAFASYDLAHCTVLQAAPQPRLGDRHREWLSDYARLAQALEPLQVRDHPRFADGSLSRWTEETTNAWLRRFTEPDQVG
jgi:hypothetical protein